MFYAGYTVSGSFTDWFVFLCPLDHHRKVNSVRSSGACHFIIDLDQTPERDHWRTTGLPCVSAFQGFGVSAFQFVAFRGDCAFACRDLVLVRLPNLAGILSAPL